VLCFYIGVISGVGSRKSVNPQYENCRYNEKE
jgi:hypothetical protein